ncbi:MAG: EscU/YscU/HrcU family type III secretion system export apparatus switch protein [Thermoleophilia bacterium]|nr:EscU/YscU/HrcU family type III secretion system export apparatus switch protein [Thermoleophilia bacterium]
MRDDPNNPEAQTRRERPADAGKLQAAALRYDTGQEHAPRLVARGAGLTAEKILALAAEHDIPVRQDPTLVSILGALDIGAEIPADLYGVIAEVLAWAYRTDQLAGEKHGRRAA